MDKTPPAMVDAAVGAAIRAARNLAGLSQEALRDAMKAEGFQVSQQTLSEIERGERKVTFGEAMGFAEVLGVPLPDLTRLKPLTADGSAIVNGTRDLFSAQIRARSAIGHAEAARGYLERAIKAAERRGLARELAREIADARKELEKGF